MPDDSVDAAVEKLTEEASKTPTPSEAPADKTPEAKDEADRQPDKQEDEGYTAFEQELIGQLSEEDRQAFEAASPEERTRTLAFAKRIYRDNAKQMTELGTYRKALAALREAGVTKEDLVGLMEQKQGRKPAPVRDGQVADRAFNRLLTQAKTPEEREIVKENEQVIREFVEDFVTERLNQELKPLRDRLDAGDRSRVSTRLQTLNQEIDALEDELGYPGSLVETHREAMRRLGMQHPDLSAEDLLVRVAGFQTVKKAMLKAGQREEASEKGERKPASPVAKPAGQKIDMPKNRRGVVSILEAVNQLVKPPKA